MPITGSSAYGIADLVRISDPDKTLYRQFGLEDAAPSAAGASACLVAVVPDRDPGGHGVGTAGPNWRQLTGVFSCIAAGRSSPRCGIAIPPLVPDYVELARGASTRRATRLIASTAALEASSSSSHEDFLIVRGGGAFDLARRGLSRPASLLMPGCAP